MDAKEQLSSQDFEQMDINSLVNYRPTDEPEAMRLIGALTKNLIAVKDVKSEIKKEEKEANEKVRQLEGKLLRLFDDMDEVDAVKYSFGSVSHSTQNCFQIDDWDAFFNFIMQTKESKFLKKAVASRAVKEMFENDNCLPAGISIYVKEKINTSKKS